MKSYFVIFGILTIIIGILLLKSQKEEIIVQKQEEEVVKEQPKQQEKVEPKYSDVFMKGYWDGYYSKVAAPVRWTLSSEYRQGFSLGKHDRLNSNHDRFK